MTILVGYLPDKGGRACLDLGAQIARSGTREPLAVATVIPQPWSTPSMAKVDAEFAAWTAEQGAAATDRARRYLAEHAPDLDATFHPVPGRSVPKALLAAAEQTGSELIVLGSSPNGAHGQVVVGATADPLLHSSPIPVAVAPRGYHATGAQICRITFAWSAEPDSLDTLLATAAWATRLGVTLRIASFGVRGRTMYPPKVGLDAEDDVLGRWVEQVGRTQQQAVAVLRAQKRLPDGTTTVVGTGRDWGQAIDELDWEGSGAGEILVLGSSPVGPVSRVFLGSKAIKIVRHAPVPVLVVPDAEKAEDILGTGPTTLRGPAAS